MSLLVSVQRSHISNALKACRLCWDWWGIFGFQTTPSMGVCCLFNLFIKGDSECENIDKELERTSYSEYHVTNQLFACCKSTVQITDVIHLESGRFMRDTVFGFRCSSFRYKPIRTTTFWIIHLHDPWVRELYNKLHISVDISSSCLLHHLT